MWKWQIKDLDEFINYWIFHIIKAFVCMRIKASASPFIIRRVKGSPTDALRWFVDCNVPDYEDYGSETLYLPPARNIPGTEYQFPTVLRKKGAPKNHLQPIDKTTGDTFKPLTLVNRSFPAGTFDPMDHTEVNLKLDLSQPEVIIEKIPQRRRNALMFTFRLFGLKLTSEASKTRKRDWLLAQYTGTTNTFKNAINMDIVPDLVYEPSWYNVFNNIPVLSGAKDVSPPEIGREAGRTDTPPVITATEETHTPNSVNEHVEPDNDTSKPANEAPAGEAPNKPGAGEPNA
jgi:hypothetical protein